MPSESRKPPPDPQLEGHVLDDRYEVEQVLGKGGIGIVYLGYERQTKQAVAIKVLRELSGAGDDVRRRFEREVRALSALEHPNIVSILDSAAAAEVPYFVMELLEGKTLRAALRGETPLSWPRARRIFSQLLDGLAYVHGRGLLHRDLKPDNVFLVGSGDDEHVKLLDFGLAKFVEASASGADATLTQTGQFFGSPGYMAPERFLEQRTDIRGDVYSATLLLYEMLAGQRPFFGSMSEVAKQQIKGQIRELSELRPGIHVSPELKALFEKGMAVELEARFPSIAELRDAFEALPDPPLAHFARSLGHHPATEGATPPDAVEQPVGGSEGEPASHTPHARPWPARARWLSAVAVGSVFAVALGWPRLRGRFEARDVPDAAALPQPTSGPAGEQPTPPAQPPAPRWQAPAADPWLGAIPPDLDQIREQLDQGSEGDDAMIASLERHNHDYPTDPRGHLLLARLYFNRGSKGEMVNQYEFAVLRQPSARGDTHMLEDLLALHDSTAWNEASELIAETYGAEAKQPIDRLLLTNLEPSSRQRLSELLAQIPSS